jgi:hypothetical protein
MLYYNKLDQNEVETSLTVATVIKGCHLQLATAEGL